jgi:hypothetical protein
VAAVAAKGQHREWLENLARLGYASRGIIYALIGVFALLAALGQAGGGTTGTKGAIASILNAPGGWVLVLVVALGLLGYSAWRFCQAVFDADAHGSGGKALVIRTGLFVSGITHLLLAIWAAKLSVGNASRGGSGGSQESLVSTLMSQSFGQWLVGALGIILIGVGLAQFLKGHGEKFEKYFSWDQETRRKLVPFCKFGLYTRGVIFAIVGGFVTYAAVTTNPSNAGGLEEALNWLQSQAYGPWLLGAVGVGLVCFGVYSVVEAVYRRVQAPG